MEFAEPGKHSSQAGQAEVCEDCEDWSLLLELNLWNAITMRPGRDNRLDNCVLARTHTVSCVHKLWCRSMPSTSSPRMSCRGRQQLLRERRELKGAWVHGICMQVLTIWDVTCTFLPRPTAQENGVLKFPDLKEEDKMLCWIQELSLQPCSMLKSVSY